MMKTSTENDMAKIRAFREQYAEYPSINDLEALNAFDCERLIKFCYKRHEVASPAYKMAKIIFNTALHYVMELEDGWYLDQALDLLWHSKNPAVAGLFDK